MLLDEATRRRGTPSLLDKVEILGSDISTTALAKAVSGRYDAIAINRGLSEERRRKYFTREEQSWVFDEPLRNRVRFRKFNLQDPFVFPGGFDLILCRYVSIYFSESFKRDMFAKLATALKPGGVLLLGATESLRDFSDAFEISYFKNAVINTKKIPGMHRPGNRRETGAAKEMGYGYG
jgi:chemotaxis protein methyltransferase CheR